MQHLMTPKAVVVAALIAGATLATPRVAASQARGTLQVSATVVPTAASFAGLTAASQATKVWVATGKQTTNDVSTVAQVQVIRLAAQNALVVEIAYVKN